MKKVFGLVAALATVSTLSGCIDLSEFEKQNEIKVPRFSEEGPKMTPFRY